MEDEAEDLETAGNGSEPKGEDQADQQWTKNRLGWLGYRVI